MVGALGSGVGIIEVPDIQSILVGIRVVFVDEDNTAAIVAKIRFGSDINVNRALGEEIKSGSVRRY